MTGRRIMTGDEIRRAVVRISHEIVEKHAGTDGLVLVGMPLLRPSAWVAFATMCLAIGAAMRVRDSLAPRRDRAAAS